MLDQDSFSVEEWAQIVSAPAAVGALVVVADPSGLMGLIGEFKAIMKTMREYVDANASSSSLMRAMQAFMDTKPTEEAEAELKKWAEDQQAEMKADRPDDPEEMKQLVRDRTSAALGIVRGKGATEEDVNHYKSMMYDVAKAVADAAKEGGFLGFGGTVVSDAEQTILAQIKSELGV